MTLIGDDQIEGVDRDVEFGSSFKGSSSSAEDALTPNRLIAIRWMVVT